MADLVGEDSHTQLQVEVVRNRLSFGEAGSSQEPFRGVVQLTGRCGGRCTLAGSGPGAGTAEGLPKVSPASSAGAVGCQFQEVSMATLRPIKEHCQFCEHMLDGDLVFRERIGTVRSKLERRERLFGRDHIR